MYFWPATFVLKEMSFNSLGGVSALARPVDEGNHLNLPCSGRAAQPRESDRFPTTSTSKRPVDTRLIDAGVRTEEAL
jgi:hypothetical protein